MRRLHERTQQTGEKEPLLNEVSIYAFEETKTHTDHVSAQGFGWSEPIEGSPQIQTYYIWEGKFQLTEDERLRGLTGANSNGHTSLEELAANLADNYQLRQIPELMSKGAAKFSLSFEIPEEAARRHRNQSGGLRNLTPSEQRMFSDVFAAATEQSGDSKFLSDAELVRIWDKAYERMNEVVPPKEREVVFTLSGSIDNPDKLEEVLDLFRAYLAPESIFFLEMSVAKKRDYEEKTSKN